MANQPQNAAIRWTDGALLPSRTLAPITRSTLALYAGGSGDHNPLHIDVDFARSVAKMEDVIGHGMLTMALVGRYVTELVPQCALRAYSIRFVGMSRVGDRLECSGSIARVFNQGGATYAQVELSARREGGDPLANGSALVSIGEI